MNFSHKEGPCVIKDCQECCEHVDIKQGICQDCKSEVSWRDKDTKDSDFLEERL